MSANPRGAQQKHPMAQAPRPSTDIDFDLTDAVPMEEMVSKAMENCPCMTNVRVDASLLF